MLPDQLVGLQELGESPLAYWVPTSHDGMRLDLEEGETVLWRGVSEISSPGPDAWSMPENTTVIVTNRRTAFLSKDFDKGGGGWVGFGAGGIALALTANAISRARAKRRSAGFVAIGHIRHEWVEAIGLRRYKAFLGTIDQYADVAVRTSDGQVVVELPLKGDTAAEFTSWLAGLIAWRRASLGAALGPQERAEIDRIAAQSHPGLKIDSLGSFGYRIPGNVEDLIALATGTRADNTEE